MKVLVVIPARYASTRFPGKMLTLVADKPLILHAWQNASRSKQVERVLVATDDERIAQVIEEAGGEAVMTDPALPSGTDRIAAAVGDLADAYDYIINIQGDEPLFTAEEMDRFISKLDGSPMATLARQMDALEDVSDLNVVKVVADANGHALYFSRLPIPCDRDQTGGGEGYLHHLGIYAYRPETLKKLLTLPMGRLEIQEKLEQLRALENGITIQVVLTSLLSIGVDVPEDVKRVESLLSKVDESV
ncbi:MAG: 3-deoxy-manno-octulosonate cytidylyltransferase [Verrucomicrobiota bacterium]